MLYHNFDTETERDNSAMARCVSEIKTQQVRKIHHIYVLASRVLIGVEEFLKTMDLEPVSELRAHG
jgi:hypothetical protein